MVAYEKAIVGFVPEMAPKVHDRLAGLVGVGTAADYRVESREGWVRVSTSLAGIGVDDLRAAVDSIGGLIIQTSITRVLADGQDVAVITASGLDGDTDVTVTVWLDNVIYMNPAIVPVEAGQVVLNFSTEFVGVYIIEIRRNQGYEAGYLRLEGI